ncbi:MAG: hypothetical protein V1495_07780 [Pseudomonadota bacterium]
MEFFRESVQRVRRKRQIQLTEMSEFYLVNLLSEAVDTRKNPPDEPLALTYGRAMGTPSIGERFTLMKQVGDRSLYVSGFFGDALSRMAVDVDYFIAMGVLAYDFVSSLAEEKKPDRGVAEMFEELSGKFAKLVDLFAEISASSGLTSDADLLRVYERWLATRNDRLRELLLEKGILPVDWKKGPLH